MTTPATLPLLDEHTVVVQAPPAAVWAALLETLDRSFGPVAAAAYAKLVGCEPPAASGPRPLAVGSTLPGFAVTRCEPDRELALDGRHRFSTYALTFRLQPSGVGTRLTAETRAVFPGVTGRAYRLLVLRTGAHVLGVRGLLAGVRRKAERTRGHG